MANQFKQRVRLNQSFANPALKKRLCNHRFSVDSKTAKSNGRLNSFSLADEKLHYSQEELDDAEVSSIMKNELIKTQSQIRSKKQKELLVNKLNI